MKRLLKKGTRPRSAFPAVRRSSGSNRTTLLLNVHAHKLLAQEGARNVIVLRMADGTLALQPLMIPANAIGISKILVSSHGSPRVSCSAMRDDYAEGVQFRCVWNDVDEMLVITKETVHERQQIVELLSASVKEDVVAAAMDRLVQGMEAE